jgi:glycyl-tRNA synthetase beta chain
MSAAVPPAGAANVADFLVEIGTEELPPLALRELETAFASSIEQSLHDAGLTHTKLHSFATPRRLAVLVENLATVQPEQEIKRRGPPVSAAFDAAGQATRAATAFAQGCGVDVGKLTRVREGKGDFLYFSGRKPGAAAETLLPTIVQTALDALPIPKRMRWGAGEAEFVRPVHWLVLMLGSRVIPARLLDTESGNTTRGHRFHAPQPILLAAPSDYARRLESEGKVLADFAARRERVRTEVLRAAGLGQPLLDDELLDEVTALVEWPVGIAGAFDAEFLKLPREVLIATLQEHQRYFPLQDARGELRSGFITVSNIESRDPGKVRAGNERVVRPRLSDAAFFYAQDRKQSLSTRRAALDTVTFQAKLGSIGDKVRRVSALSAQLAQSLGADPKSATQIAELAKCDLVTGMVGEFPELQGTMGRYYALADGLPSEIADGIADHYLPRGAGDALPRSAAAICVALADRLDTLAGIFAMGQKPTGAKDPFGLRRAAIGVLRILLEKKLELNLDQVIDSATAAQPVKSASAAAEVREFLRERLRGLLVASERGVTTEMFDAVLAAAPRSPTDTAARLDALRDFLQRPEAASLAAANKRIANILKKSAPTTASGTIDSKLLREPAEAALFAALQKEESPITQAVAQGDYAAALTRLAGLRSVVDTFFDKVLVNDTDALLRANRHALLASLRALFTGIADLSLLPG